MARPRAGHPVRYNRSGHSNGTKFLLAISFDTDQMARSGACHDGVGNVEPLWRLP